MALPPWLWGNDVAAFLKLAALSATRAAGGWQVRADTVGPRSHDALIRVLDLAGKDIDPTKFADLREFEPSASPLSHDYAANARSELERRAEHGNRIGEPTSTFALHRLDLVTAPPQQLPRVAAAVYESLRDTRTLEDPNLAVFANAGAHFIARRWALIHRVKLISVLLRVDQDPRLRAGDLAAIRTVNGAGQTVFDSSAELLSGAVLLDAYLGPLLGALSPAIWAFAAPRSGGVLVFTLGRPLSGTTGSAAESLQILSVPGPTESSFTPNLTPGASRAALTWWARRLAGMFAVLTDPSIFTDDGGNYLPYAHLHALLNVEQIFRRISSIQSGWRDANARRVLLFTVLDTLVDGLFASRSFDELCSLRFARGTLDRLRARIPADAAEVLLPAAESAVDALEQLQDGFFLRRQTGAARVELLYPDGRIEKLWPDDAAAEYLKVLRNATHGYASNQASQFPRTNALLAQHTGNMPHNLSQLGYLYLLELLSDPQSFKRSLRERVR